MKSARILIAAVISLTLVDAIGLTPAGVSMWTPAVAKLGQDQNIGSDFMPTLFNLKILFRV